MLSVLQQAQPTHVTLPIKLLQICNSSSTKCSSNQLRSKAAHSALPNIHSGQLAAVTVCGVCGCHLASHHKMAAIDTTTRTQTGQQAPKMLCHRIVDPKNQHKLPATIVCGSSDPLATQLYKGIAAHSLYYVAAEHVGHTSLVSIACCY
jgi:hypothetical protein